MNLVAPLAQITKRTKFQFTSVRDPEDWLLPVAVTSLVVAYSCWMYVRDARDLRRSTAGVLMGLRVAAFLALAFLWLDPQWRTEQFEPNRSRVILLVDTSSSMAEPAVDGTRPGDETVEGEGPTLKPGSRSAHAARFLDETLAKLNRTHDVHVLTFDAGHPRNAGVFRYGEPIDPKTSPVPAEKLAPLGKETQLGEAVKSVLEAQTNKPVSGIVVLSDGRFSGLDPTDAIAQARLQNSAVPPILTVGLGSSTPIRNVGIQSVSAPPRVYPTDEFPVKVQLQGQGMAGEKVKVELSWRDAGGGSAGDIERVRTPGNLDPEQRITFPAEGEPPTADFILRPKRLGGTVLTVKLAGVPADDRHQYDNVVELNVEITERRNKILLFASAATREYQFLRNQLQRLLLSNGSKDKEFVVDVYLQTGSVGISQDSSVILSDFPADEKTMFDYDCVIAFDPNWGRLTEYQVDLLQRWVSEQAGGLILVAGRINTEYVARDPKLAVVRGLYPVEFGRVVSMPGESSGAAVPWKIELTEQGKKSEFLRLSGSTTIDDFWKNSFPGFYDCFPAKAPKDKAVVLAGLKSPQSENLGPGFADTSRSMLLVEQPLGAGRVLYVGSGEFWRLRLRDSRQFTQVYTQMVRHTAQARLLRDSKHGVLLLNHDNGRYDVGDLVEATARLTDSRQQPLAADEVTLQIIWPDGKLSEETLKHAETEPTGTFHGMFEATQVGPYRLDLIVPEAGGEPLTRRLQVQEANTEGRDPTLNAKDLEALAQASIDPGSNSETPIAGYYRGVDEALGGRSETDPAGPLKPVVEMLLDRTNYTPRVEINDWLETAAFKFRNPLRRANVLVTVRYGHVAIAVVCLMLCLEWLIRRLSKLA